MTESKKFWGLILENGKKYAQQVDQAIVISQVQLLDVQQKKNAKQGGGKDETVRVFVTVEGKDYLLCQLDREDRSWQTKVCFEQGAKVNFRLEGGGPFEAHVLGYQVGAGQPVGVQNGIASSAQTKKEASNAKQIRDVSKPDPTNKAPAKVANAPAKQEKKALVSDKKNASIPVKNTTAADDENDDNEEDNDLFDLDDEEDSDDDDDDSEDDDMESGFGIGKAAGLAGKGQKQGTESKPKDWKSKPNFDDFDDSEDESDEEDEDVEEEEDDDESAEGLDGYETEIVAENAKSIVQKPGTKKNESINKAKVGKNDSLKIANSAATSASPPKKAKLGAQPTLAEPAPKTTPVKTAVNKNGIIIEEIKVGNGPVAKMGKWTNLYYVGRLKSNNKVFDSSQSGKGFGFRLGAGEVIKGWDIGVEGMKVGGKRKLIIPPNLAYGKRGAPPDIPPGATLVFEVELKSMK